jgi:uncharacterized cupin superfamily protein
MRKVNIDKIEERAWGSPRGTFAGSGRDVSIALGRKRDSTDLLERHPFDVEILRVAPGCKPYPYHSHSAQWEYYQVVSGSGWVRHEAGTEPIVAGDAFIFKPGEAHQLGNDGAEDLLILVVADNPFGESWHYPDSGKWAVQHPERRNMRGEALDYFDGEE